MVQRGNGLRLAVEPLLHLRVFGELRGQHLDCDGPVQPRVGSLVDFSHAARTRRREDFVRTERDSWLEGHGSPRLYAQARQWRSPREATRWSLATGEGRRGRATGACSKMAKHPRRILTKCVASFHRVWLFALWL